MRFVQFVSLIRCIEGGYNFVTNVIFTVLIKLCIVALEIGRTIDWGEYDVDVVTTPADNGREDLSESIEAQGGYYVDLFTPPYMGFNQPTYTDKELEQDLVDFDLLSGQNESEPAAYMSSVHEGTWE